MKNHLFKIASLCALSTILLFNSCKKDDDNEVPNELLNEFTVDPYNNFSLAGEVTVKFTNTSKSSLKADSEYTVKINATPDQRRAINVENTNGRLRITADERIDLDDNVVIELTHHELMEIRLERDEHAVFWGIEQDEVVVVTEANSELSLFESMIGALTSKQEGESVLNLTTFGDFVIGFCDFKTEGNSTIYASNAPILDVHINLEGSSLAEIWAIDRITGKGEGSSTLYYRGNPDISEFITEGEARIIPLP